MTHVALRVIPFILLAAAAWVLWREFRHLSWAAVSAAIAGWGLQAIAIALVLSVLSFALMGAIEWVGLRWTGARVSIAATQMGSFLANAIAHAIGAHLLISGAIRARFYGRFGSPRQARLELAPFVEEHRFETRLVDGRVQVELDDQEFAGALAILDEALAARPDDAELRGARAEVERARQAFDARVELELSLADPAVL